MDQDDAPPAPADPRPSIWPPALGGLRAAAMLLSRVPVGRGDTTVLARRWASAWFPLVGAAPAATATIALLALLTGALHEDGLADSADALGGARDRARILAILKDSRHGTYGVLALVLSLLLRIGGLERVATTTSISLVATLTLAGLLSRAAMTALLFALPYVTPLEGARSADVAHAALPQVSLAFALAAAGTVALALATNVSGAAVAAAWAGSIVVTVAAGRVFHVRAGGITGDFLGATAQLVEVASLIAVAVTTL